MDMPDFQIAPPVAAWAIFHTKTGKWSRGGAGPKWGKKPKIWASMGHLKNHLSMFVHTTFPMKSIKIIDPYADCIIWDVVANEQWGKQTFRELYDLHIERTYRTRRYYDDYPVVYTNKII